MLEIRITNLTKKRIPPRALLKKAAKTVLRREHVTSGELNIVFMSDRRIKKLNQKFKKKNYPTDVLAFNTNFIGDIAISLDTAKRQAREFGSGINKEIYLYIIHGILHLLGYDDQTARKRKLMRKKEASLLELVWNSIT